MIAMNRAMVIAGVATLFQALGQIIFTATGLMQYFCAVNFLMELPLLVFIRILYFHNPSLCGTRINLGQVIEGVPPQAFVIMSEVPFTTLRTFIINCISLALGVLWFIACIGLMKGGAKTKETKPIRWSWIIITVMVCALDLVATATYANDSFHTRTFSEAADFINVKVSGIGNVEINTSWAAWVMVIFYSRFAIFFVLNMSLVVSVVLHGNGKREKNISVQVEVNQACRYENGDSESSELNEPVPRIPRPELTLSFRRIKERLFINRVPTQVTQIILVQSPFNTTDVSPDK